MPALPRFARAPLCALILAAATQAAPVSVNPIESGPPSATQLYVSATGSTADAGQAKSVWVAALLPGNPSFFFHTPTGWAAWNGSTPPAALLTTTTDTVSFDALGGTLNLSSLAGAQVYVGLAQSWSELLASGDYALAYTVPAVSAPTATAYVATTGSDNNPGTQAQPWRTIQHAADTVAPGTTVYVRGGTYAEQVNILHSGSASAGYTTFTAYPGETPVVDGSSLQAVSAGLFNLLDVSYVQVSGFEVRNYTTSSANVTPAGIFVTGAGDHIVIANNYVHDISTTVNDASGNAFGLAVYGTRAPASINTISITGNELAHLKTGSSESMSINGNVQYFSVTNNKVHDNSNIGIDIIGYESVAPDSNYDRARDGVVSGNTVYNISSYGNPAYGNNYGADGLYVDGGTRIIIERNTVSTSDLGIEVTSEHLGRLADYVTVRSNVFYKNLAVGMSIGGYDAQRGGTDHCSFVNNTLYGNDTLHSGSGEFGVQYHATNNVFENNIVYANSQGVLFSEVTSYTAAPVSFDGNLYFSAAAAGQESWTWNGVSLNTFAAFQAATGGDAHSLHADPQFTNAASANFLPGKTSPAVNAGLALGTALMGSQDYAGNARVQGAGVDIGAYEQ